MIPRTYPSSFNSSGRHQMLVYFLSSVTGLVRWVDYIPVKNSTAATVKPDTYDNDGVILIKDIGSTYGKRAWLDYVPVYLDLNATDAWQVDGEGFIPAYPSPTLSLDFTSSSETLDPRITFSRASNATRVNSAGLIEYAPHNLLTFSEQFDNAYWVKSDATVVANAAVAPNGTTTADKLVETATTAIHYINNTAATFPASTPITGSFYAKAGERTSVACYLVDTGIITATTTVFNLSNGTITSGSDGKIESVGNGWYRCSVTATATSITTTAARLRIFLQSSSSYAGDGTSGLYIWGAQLNVGALQPYYPTTVKNLLGFSESFENAAWTKSNSFIQTNLLTWSEQFDNAAWTKTRSSISSNVTATADPLGNNYADKLVENTDNNSHFIQQTASVSAVSYTVSVYAKADTRSQFALNLGDAMWNDTVLFDLSAQTTTTLAGSPTNILITSIGNGWYRCSFSKTASTSGTAAIRAFLANSGSISYTGDGTSGLYIWGAQLVQGSTAGDYQQTLSAALPVMYRAPNGTMTADKLVEDTATNTHLVQPASSPSYTSGVSYTYSVFAKASERTFLQLRVTAGNTFSASFNLSTGVASQLAANTTAAVTSAGNNWYRCSITFSATSTGTGASRIGLLQNETTANYTGDGTSGIYIWGAQLSDSASLDTYVATPGAAPTSTAYYGPRFTYDPVTKAPLGLLIEEQRSNLVLNSDTLTTQNVTVAAVAHTLSFYGTGTVTLSGVSTAGPLVGTGDYPNRVTLTFTPTAGTLTLTVSGSVRFAQLEAGAFATSYIPTTTASATRSADVATITGSNFSSFYRADEGTLFADYLERAFSATHQVLYASSGAAAERITLNINSSNVLDAQIVSGGTDTFIGNTPTLTTQNYKLALAYKINDSGVSANGSAVTTDTSVVLPVGVSQLNIGATVASAQFVNSTIKGIAYYPRRLANSELQALTS